MEENKLIEEATEAVKKNQNAGCYVEGLLAVIHRLQENNANQVRMRCDMQRKFDDLQTLCTEQKAEIERLTEELKKATETTITASRCFTRMETLYKVKCKELEIAEEKEKQSVKDTAKEILTEIRNNDGYMKQANCIDLCNRFGVEVE